MKTKMKFSALQVINSDSSITMDHNRKRKKRRHQKVDAFTSFKPELNNAKKRKKKKQTSSRSSFLDQVLKGASAEYPKSQSSVMSDEDDLEEEEREGGYQERVREPISP